MSSDDASPSLLHTFVDCHAGIVEQLQILERLARPGSPEDSARRQAADILAFFDNVVRRHHREEEQLLFTAALAEAYPGAEREGIDAAAKRLTAEHRELEALIDKVRPSLAALKDGNASVSLDRGELLELPERYKAHARYEESSFLPQVQEILERGGPQLAQLGLQLHLHDPVVQQQLHFGRWT